MTSGDIVVPKVFISYAHESDAIASRVQALADRLRHDGIDCMIDQYEPFPPEGWPEWMNRQIERSHFVLVLCTRTYDDRFRRRDQNPTGLGVKWEGAIITQQLYEMQLRNTKFIPVVFQSSDAAFIPLPLRASSYYSVGTDEGYDDLYRLLTAQPGTPKVALGPIRTMPTEVRVTFPRLAHDVEGAVSVILNESNYVFRVFNVGERGTVLDPELVEEVLNGLSERIRPMIGSIDYLIAEDPGGIRWALLLARDLRLPLRMITSQGAGIADQTFVTQTEGFYAGRTLWFPRVSAGDHVVVIDDVIDTGGTMRTIVNTLRNDGVTVLGIFSIVRKTGPSRSLEQDLQLPVMSLLDIETW